MIKIIYLDESGDHSLAKIDAQYPIFVLGGAIFEKEYAETVLIDKIDTFKKDVFENERIILHTADISRNRNGFEILINPIKRKEFYEKINCLMRELDYKAVACVIKKDLHYDAYQHLAFDPYNFSLQILIERFCYELTKSDRGIIMAEKRNADLDKKLINEWEHIKLQGTRHVKPSEIRKKITDFQLVEKSQNNVGLQIADLIVSPIGRYVQGKPLKEDTKIIIEKLRKDSLGEFMGHGLVVLPRT